MLANQLCSVLPLCVEVQQSLCLLHGPEPDAPFIQSSGEIVTLFVLCHTEVAEPSSYRLNPCSIIVAECTP